jgi:glucosamine--fructose-6-phosphate aminotransferase (isomerizing)
MTVSATPTMAGYVAEQPAALRRTLAEGPALVREVLDVLGRDFDSVHLVGSGTSHFAALATIGSFAPGAAAHLPTDFLHFVDDSLIGERSLVIAVSQSGRSTGTLAAIARARSLGATTLLVSGDATSSPAHATLDVRCGPELVGAKTKGFVCTVAALRLLADGLAGRDTDLSALPSLIERQLASAPTVIGDFLGDAVPGGVTLLSYGPALAAASEAGLKILETARIAVEVVEVEEYLHGPHRRLTRSSLLVVLAPSGPVFDRAAALTDFATGVGARVLVLSDAVVPSATASITVAATGALAYIAPLQLLAIELSARHGRSPEDPVFAGFHERLASKTPIETEPPA